MCICTFEPVSFEGRLLGPDFLWIKLQIQIIIWNVPLFRDYSTYMGFLSQMNYYNTYTIYIFIYFTINIYWSNFWQLEFFRICTYICSFILLEKDKNGRCLNGV